MTNVRRTLDRGTWAPVHMVGTRAIEALRLWTRCGLFLGRVGLLGRIVDEPATCLWCVAKKSP